MKRPSPATIIASIALFFSLAGTGLAAKHYLITKASQIKPGVLDQLRGPRGPQGPQGAAGTAGAAGAAGAAGTFSSANVTAVVGAAPAGIPANQSSTSVASCPAGTKVIGGGYTWGGVGTAPANVTVVADQAQSTTGWVVTIQNNTATAISTQFAASALCA